MKKNTLFSLCMLFLFSCSTVKTTQKAVNSGNYEKAISLSIEKLRKDKIKEKYQPYVFALQEAFEKASKRDLDKITFLKKDQNPENLESIYRLYNNLKQRQEDIKPLLPLKNIKTGKNVAFNFKNYNSEIINSKNNVSEYLYAKAKSLFSSNNKLDFRKVFDDLSYIEKINPNYKDVRKLMEEAHLIGTDFVFVSVKNETDKVVPKKLEEDLLNIDTYGLNDLWTVFHSKKDKKINYDFSLELSLRNINVSPEQVREKQIIKEKQIKDGLKDLLDSNGNIVKDTLGKNIKVDNLIKVRCEFYQFTQFKSAKVAGQVTYYNYNTRQVEQSFPINTEFVFEHVYANHRGDKRALETSLLDLLKVREVRFPTNEQMIYDTGTDLKEKLKYIITRNRFR